jgi:ferredoxin
MLKVTIDTSTCVGCGLCEQECPEVFKVEGDGIAHVKSTFCDKHNLQAVADQCPVTSIKVSQQ